MKILIENGCYHLRNMGDVAMLQVAVDRLSDLWPDASIEVITDDPDLLAVYCPKARPVSARGRRVWFRSLFGDRLHRRLPASLAAPLLKLEREIRRRSPSLVHTFNRCKSRYTESERDEANAFLKSFFGADLLVFSGGGDFNDAFKKGALKLLETLSISTRREIPTALLGQGMGPIQDPELLAGVRAVLPFVDFIAIRERRSSPQLLDSLGVAPSRVFTTGDDAVEPAYRARPDAPGTGIGVNLRLTAYSEVNRSSLEMIRTVLHEKAREYNAPLIPLPISFHEKESDVKTIHDLLRSKDNGSKALASFDGSGLDHPGKIIEQAGRCRMVVTGSYHSAVFPLSQGIPVVCVAKSDYYRDKFLGLADQFGVGCDVLFPEESHFREKLIHRMENAWRSSAQVRDRLLESAARQIDMGRSAYRIMYEIVEAKRGQESSLFGRNHQTVSLQRIQKA